MHAAIKLGITFISLILVTIPTAQAQRVKAYQPPIQDEEPDPLLDQILANKTDKSTNLDARQTYFRSYPQHINENFVRTTIDFRQEGYNPIRINAIVNGQGPFDFIVDTGASSSFMFSHAAHRLNLRETGDQSQIHGLVNADTRPVIAVESLKIGELEFANMEMHSLQAWHDIENRPDGVIGLDVISQYVMHIDQANKQFSLIASDHFDRRAHRGFRKIRLKRNPFLAKNETDRFQLYYFDMRLEGKRVPVLLDTGSDIAILNSQTMLFLLKGMRVNTRKLRTIIQGAIDDTKANHVVSSRDVRIGGHTIKRQIFIVHDAAALVPLGAATEPLIISGMEMFSDRSVIFDFPDSRIYMNPTKDRVSEEMLEEVLGEQVASLD